MVENVNGSFYKIAPNNGGAKVIIEKTKLLTFWESLGYRKLILKSGKYELVKVTNNSIVEIVEDYRLAGEVRNHLESLNHQIVFEEFLKKDYASNSLIKNLKGIEITFNNGNSKEAQFFYKNGVVKISSERYSIISYVEFEGYVWKHQIIDRDFNPSSEYGSAEFAIFVKNLAGKNLERYRSLRSIIGYLLHSYKDPVNSPAIILLDEDMDLNQEEAKGGKGKSLLAKGIGKIVPYYFKEGKNFSKNFLFSGLEKHHKVIFLDDVKKDFDFEILYAIITGDFSFEKKFKNEEVIPFPESPKMLISSNYMVSGVRGYSEERRKVEFEISSYYGRHLTPIQDFGHRLFDDWDEMEWRKFDSFMIICCREYLRDGLIKPKSINLLDNKLKTDTDPKFVEFMDEEIKEDCRIDKKEFLNKFKEKYNPEFCGLSPNLFSKWLSIWADFKAYQSDHKKSNGKQYFEIVIKK
ncbi:primase-helicase family protein [Flavobacterium sp.]|uniref:primase-helicase family protein n=1 Tax=Flavobacterium sp. TaxID=239 RepID=UPI00262E06C4|nr:primase-helicase family protein [Flavobacterium sp.]